MSGSPAIEQAIASLGSGSDVDGDTRDASTPDIGADEYDQTKHTVGYGSRP